MTLGRNSLPVAFCVSGLMGISFLLLADHYQLAIMPTADFAKGFWFGVCIGVELLGLIILLKGKAKAGRNSAS